MNVGCHGAAVLLGPGAYRIARNSIRLLVLAMALASACLAAGCGPTTQAAAHPASGVENPAAWAITPATLAPETARAPAEVPTTPSVATATLTATSDLTNSSAPAPTIAAAPTATRVPTIASSATPGAVSVEPPPSTPSAEIVSAVVERGLQVYQQSYCGLCHQLDAARTAGQFGPTHNHMGTTAALRIRDKTYTGTARTAAEYIRESIVNPQVYIVAGYEQSQYHMPPFAKLSEADLDALVQMLLQQK
jgi:mono/diheme cytochrome c family protein